MESKMRVISPSLLSADFSRLKEQIKLVEDLGIDRLHIDVMDGHFVPNLTFGPFIINDIRKVTKSHLETHLMIEDGAIKEVKNLLKLNYNNSLPIMKAHGVPEIQSYLNNEVSIEECISKIQQVTRNYVKRQHTWWRSSNLNIFKKFDQFPDEIDLKSINLEQN